MTPPKTEQRLARSPEDLAPRDVLLSMSGLEFMRAALAGTVAGPAIMGPMGFRLYRVDPGEVAFRGAADFSHTNMTGGVHGGWYGTILDSSMGCAVMTAVPRGSHYTTLEYRVNILRALPTGVAVEALGLVQHSGRSTAVARGEVRGLDDGRLYATGSTTCLIMTP